MRGSLAAMRYSLKVITIGWGLVFCFSCSSGDSQLETDQGTPDSTVKRDTLQLPDAPLADRSLPDQSAPPADSQPVADSPQTGDSETPVDMETPADQTPVHDAPQHTEAAPDVLIQGDLLPQPDLPPHLEASIPHDLSLDFPAGTLSCGEVYICAQACTSTDPSCLPGCIAQGCGSATDTVVADFAECFYAQCYSECLISFDAACRSCISTNCSAEASACTTHQC